MHWWLTLVVRHKTEHVEQFGTVLDAIRTSSHGQSCAAHLVVGDATGVPGARPLGRHSADHSFATFVPQEELSNFERPAHCSSMPVGIAWPRG